MVVKRTQDEPSASLTKSSMECFTVVAFSVIKSISPIMPQVPRVSDSTGNCDFVVITRVRRIKSEFCEKRIVAIEVFPLPSVTGAAQNSPAESFLPALAAYVVAVILMAGTARRQGGQNKGRRGDNFSHRRAHIPSPKQ